MKSPDMTTVDTSNLNRQDAKTAKADLLISLGGLGGLTAFRPGLPDVQFSVERVYLCHRSRENAARIL
jgi:hypothetical protein